MQFLRRATESLVLFLCSMSATQVCSHLSTVRTNGLVDLLPQSTVLAESLIDEAHLGLAAALSWAQGGSYWRGKETVTKQALCIQ